MPETAYTPGPWHVDEVNTPNGRSYDVNAFTDGQDLANARLRAAAPDLLEALKHAHETIADLQRAGCHAGPIAVPSIIRDAITKAEGGAA